MKPTEAEKEAEVQRILAEVAKTMKQLEERLARIERDRRVGYGARSGF